MIRQMLPRARKSRKKLLAAESALPKKAKPKQSQGKLTLKICLLVSLLNFSGQRFLRIRHKTPAKISPMTKRMQAVPHCEAVTGNSTGIRKIIACQE